MQIIKSPTGPTTGDYTVEVDGNIGKVLTKLAERYPERITAIDHDEDGYWIYLRNGWSWEGCHTIHEDTVVACMECWRSVYLGNID